MVVIDDFRKQILYQRLNLGYECTFCKRKFYSKREQLQHLQEFHLKSQRRENFECLRCGKVFGHVHIYRLHQQIHALSEPDVTSEGNSKNEAQNTDCVPQSLKKSPSQSCNTKQKPKISNAKKAVGLTKIKMEDCLRCDECSCIYIDRTDYYKHMRNFHKVDCMKTSVTSSVKPTVEIKQPITLDTSPTKPTVSKKMCKSCCKRCRDGSLSKETCRHQHSFHVGDSVSHRSSNNELFRFSMQDNIKDRWSKIISQRLLGSREPRIEDVKIKPDPDAPDTEPIYSNSLRDSEEMSHLLSQVEVKIKTEPIDYR